MLPNLDALEASLLNTSGDVKLDARFRTLFTLKGLASLSEDRLERVIEIISKGFADDSALLKHEMAYVLGQLKDTRALPCLNKVLSDEKEHAMVRHEAAEAMGAISSPDALPVLNQYLQDPDVSVRETCHLAINKIQLDNSDTGKAEQQVKEQRDKAHGDAIDAAARYVSLLTQCRRSDRPCPCDCPRPGRGYAGGECVHTQERAALPRDAAGQQPPPV